MRCRRQVGETLPQCRSGRFLRPSAAGRPSGRSKGRNRVQSAGSTGGAVTQEAAETEACGPEQGVPDCSFFKSETLQHEDDLMKDTGRMELLQSVRDGMQRRLAEAMIRKGLGDVLPSYGDVLCRLRLAGNPVPVSELVATLRRPKSTITKATDFLAREGLLRKRPNPGDGRSILVELTESGAAFVDAFDEARSAVGDVMFQGFSGEERRHFFDMLERMESNLYTR